MFKSGVTIIYLVYGGMGMAPRNLHASLFFHLFVSSVLKSRYEIILSRNEMQIMSQFVSISFNSSRVYSDLVREFLLCIAFTA